MKMALTALGILAAVGCNKPGGADPGSNDTTRSGEQTAPDNTANNARDRGAMMKTPGDQGGSEMDRTITQQIRKDVVGEDGLSVSGKNVKIMTVDGVVTLRGPVASAQEKAEIAQLVHKVDGVKRVENQLEVAAK